MSVKVMLDSNGPFSGRIEELRNCKTQTLSDNPDFLLSQNIKSVATIEIWVNCPYVINRRDLLSFLNKIPKSLAANNFSFDWCAWHSKQIFLTS